MNHKKYLRTKLKEMKTNNLSMDPTPSSSQRIMCNSHETESQNNTLYKFSPNSTFRNDLASPKNEEKYLDYKINSFNQSRLITANTSNSQEKKLEINSLKSSYNYNSPKHITAGNNEMRERMYTSDGVKEDIYVKGHYAVAINQLNERLLVKTKQNKHLEKELKEKTDLIKRLTSKLDKQKQEISILTEKLNHEKSMIVKVEMNNLTRKLQQKEQENEEISDNFEEIINQYKNSLEKCIHTHNQTHSKLKGLEEYNQSILNQNEELLIKNAYLEKELKRCNEDLRNEIEEKTKTNVKLNHLNQLLKTLSNLIMNYNKNYRDFQNLEGKLMSNMRLVFENVYK